MSPNAYLLVVRIECRRNTNDTMVQPILNTIYWFTTAGRSCGHDHMGISKDSHSKLEVLIISGNVRGAGDLNGGLWHRDHVDIQVVVLL
jgi:hypothetical protein